MLTLLLLIVSIANAEGIYSEAKTEVKKLLADAILNEKPCNETKVQNNITYDKLSPSIDMTVLNEKFKNLKVIMEAENQATLSMIIKNYRKCKYQQVLIEKSSVAPCDDFLNKYQKSQPKWISKVDKELIKKCPKDLQSLTPSQKTELAESLMKDDELLPKHAVRKIIEKL